MAVTDIRGTVVISTGSFPPCRVATTAAITLSGLQTIDGVTVAANDRVLVKNQVTQTANGIYTVQTGTWTRANDAATNLQFLSGMEVLASAGTVNGGQAFICTCTDSPVVIGTSSLTFASETSVQNTFNSATSTSSNTIGTGAKTFATQTGKNFTAGQWVIIYQTSAPSTNSMLAQITSYSGSSLVVNSTQAQGSGTITDWSITLTNSGAALGLQPPAGTGVTGPGSSVSGNLPTFADTSGKLLQDSGKAPGTLATRNTLQFNDAATSSIQSTALAPGAAPLPFVAAQTSDNLALTNDGTNPNRDVNVTAGRVRSDGDATNLHLAATMVKKLDTAWAAGGNAAAPVGGCDTGTKGASQTWHQFLIGKLAIAVTSWSRTTNVTTLVATGHGLGVGGTIRVQGVNSTVDGIYAITVVSDANHVAFANTGSDVGATGVTATCDGFDVLASQTYASPTMPSGWTVKQCLGSILTDGSGNILAFTQVGDFFRWAAPPLDVSTTTLTTSSSSFAISVPNGVSVFAKLNVVSTNASTSVVYIRNPSDTDTAPSATAAPGANAGFAGGSTAIIAVTSVDVSTNTTQQIAARASTTNTTLRCTTVGWRDPRRRLF